MKKSSAPLFALSTWLLLSATLGCGSSNRQLQSIATNSQGMTQFQLTATGTFSASPTTVSPLPVAWFQVGQTFFPPFTYKLTSQPLVTGCPTLAAVIAIAPTNPKAPSTGTLPEQGLRGSRARSYDHLGRGIRGVDPTEYRVPVVVAADATC
jgi:hypothetical protein